MGTTSNKKSSSKVRAAKSRRKEAGAVQRVARAVTLHMAKPRAGFAELVEPFAKLVAKYEAELGPGLDVELMRSSLKAYQALDAEHHVTVQHLGDVDSARLFQGSTTWAQILLMYDRLRSVARINRDLGADLEPIEAFFRIGPNKKPEPAPVTTTGTTPTTP